MTAAVDTHHHMRRPPRDTAGGDEAYAEVVLVTPGLPACVKLSLTYHPQCELHVLSEHAVHALVDVLVLERQQEAQRPCTRHTTGRQLISQGPSTDQRFLGPGQARPVWKE